MTRATAISKRLEKKLTMLDENFKRFSQIIEALKEALKDIEKYENQ